jgi:hypothetical protein
MPLIELRFGLAHDGDVRMTKSTATYFDQKLSGTRRWFGHILKLRSLLRLEEPVGNHLIVLLLIFFGGCGVRVVMKQSRCRSAFQGKSLKNPGNEVTMQMIWFTMNAAAVTKC